MDIKNDEDLRCDVRSTLKTNLQKILDANHWTQGQLAEILGVGTKSTISNYLNPDSDNIPDILSLSLLKEKLGIPLDALITPGFQPESITRIDNSDISEYDKFLGAYSLYYISSSKISAVPSPYTTAELSFGVLALVKLSQTAIAVTKDSYKVFACFSLRTKEEANQLKAAVADAVKRNDIEEIGQLFNAKRCFATGDFELIQKGKFYAMSLTSFSVVNSKEQNISSQRMFPSDKVLLIGFNPYNTDPGKQYIGGGMVCSSISRGSKKSPCAQIMISSREILEDCEEILPELQKNRSTTPLLLNDAATKIIDRFKQLNEKDCYNDDEKDILFEKFIQRCIEDMLNKNMSQLFYLLEEEDKLWYDFLKNQQKTSR